MAQSTVWTYHTPTSELRLENVDGEFLLTGEFEGNAQRLGAGPDLRALVISLAASLETSDPFMRGIKTLRVQGDAHGWDLDRMVLEK